MDHKEQTLAGNALVNWFNSMEVSPADAQAIMSKVMAKIIVGNISGATTPEVRRELDGAIDRVTLQLIHDINDRIFHVRRR
jgi:hypothetical protein